MSFPLSVAILLMASAASAQTQTGGPSFPIVDVEGGCRREFEGETNVIAICVNREQKSYDYGRLLWRRLPEAAQRGCLERFKDYKASIYYSVLQKCLEAEFNMERIREQQRLRPFRY